MPKCEMKFFNSLGGVSEGIFKSLNCDLNSGDDLNHIKINRKIVCNSFSGNNKIFTVKQFHSDKVYVLKDINDLTLENKIECDAIITNLIDVLIGITTADCCPILLHDEENGIVGACHAGWRGAISDIFINLLNSMKENFGSQVQKIKVFIGPTIHKKNYQIQRDFYDVWINKNKNFNQFFTKNSSGYHFDLPSLIIYKLENLGIVKNNIVNNEIDTFSNSEYFSYRREIMSGKIKSGNTTFGRNISVIKNLPS